MGNIVCGDIREFQSGMSVSVTGVFAENNLEVAVFQDEVLINRYTGVFSGTYENHDFLTSPIVKVTELEELSKKQSLEHLTVQIVNKDGLVLSRCYIAGEHKIGKSKKYHYDILFENGMFAREVLLKDLVRNANPLMYMVESSSSLAVSYLENGNLAGTTLPLSKDGMTYEYKIEDVRYPISRAKTPRLYLEYNGMHFVVQLSGISRGVSPECSIKGSDLMYKTFSDGYRMVKVDNRVDMISCVDSDGVLFYNMTIQQLVDCTREDFYGLKALASDINIVSLNGDFKKTSSKRLSKSIAYSKKRWLIRENVVKDYTEFPCNVVLPNMFFYDGSTKMEGVFGDSLQNASVMEDKTGTILDLSADKPKLRKSKKQETEEKVDECPFDEDECPFEEDKVVANDVITENESNEDTPLMPENTDVDMSIFYSEEEVSEPVKEPEPEKPVHEELFLGTWYTHKDYGELRIVQSPDLQGLVTGVDRKGNPHMGLKVCDFV